MGHLHVLSEQDIHTIKNMVISTILASVSSGAKTKKLEMVITPATQPKFLVYRFGELISTYYDLLSAVELYNEI